MTGIIKVPGLYMMIGLTYRSPVMIGMTLVYDWSGVILGVLAGLHIVIHRRWIIAMTRRYCAAGTSGS